MSELPMFVSEAPDQIKSAVRTVVAADEAFFAQMKAVNFDFAKLTPAAVAAAQSPSFIAADNTIETYLKSTCGIDPTAVAS